MVCLVKTFGDVKCYECWRKCKQGGYCIEVTSSELMIKPVRHHYHIKCYGESHSTQPPHRLCQLLGEYGFNRIDPKCRTEIIRHVYPGVMLPEHRMYLSLSKPINKMTVKELKSELQKRDLCRFGNKETMTNTLQEYMDDLSVRKIKSKIVSMGYCRKMEGLKHKMSIPLSLKKIIVDYFGIAVCPCHRIMGKYAIDENECMNIQHSWY